MTDAFGKALRLMRETHGYGLREAARKLEISPPYLSLLESYHETNPPSELVIEKMARVYGVDKNDLMELAGRVPSGVIEYLADHWHEVKEIQKKISAWMKEEKS